LLYFITGMLKKQNPGTMLGKQNPTEPWFSPGGLPGLRTLKTEQTEALPLLACEPVCLVCLLVCLWSADWSA